MTDPVDVAIIGSGPAGLGAAIALRARGVKRVVIVERDVEAGGIPRQCAHPPYGLREFGRLMTGPTYARRLRARAIDHGVDILTRHSVTELLPAGMLAIATPQGERRISARRVIVATGARETPRSARLLSGDRPLAIVNTATLQDALYLNGMRPFFRPVVIGSELVALSALWTCVSHGMRPVAMIEEDSRATARWPLGLFPHLLGIPFHKNARLLEFVGKDKVEAVRIEQPSGQREIACDGVILSGRFLPEASLVRASTLKLDRHTGGPEVDQFGRCSDAAYFAAGNLLRPVETAGWCHREGLRVGGAVADDLFGLLPVPERSIAIKPGTGIAWVLPQRMLLPTTQGVELRADRAVRGKLTVRAGDRLLWSRAISTRRERRLKIPAIALDGAGADIIVAIES